MKDTSTVNSFHVKIKSYKSNIVSLRRYNCVNSNIFMIIYAGVYCLSVWKTRKSLKIYITFRDQHFLSFTSQQLYTT